MRLCRPSQIRPHLDDQMNTNCFMAAARWIRTIDFKGDIVFLCALLACWSSARFVLMETTCGRAAMELVTDAPSSDMKVVEG